MQQPADAEPRPTAEDLLLRLITGRERLTKPEDGHRLIAEYRDQVLTEAAEIAERGSDCVGNCSCVEDPRTARGAAATIRAVRAATPAAVPSR